MDLWSNEVQVPSTLIGTTMERASLLACVKHFREGAVKLSVSHHSNNTLYIIYTVEKRHNYKPCMHMYVYISIYTHLIVVVT